MRFKGAKAKISQNKVFDLETLGNNYGCSSFTLRNTGTADIIIADVNEIVKPGDSFVIGSNEIVVDEIPVEFVKEEGKVPEAIVRYLIPIIECN